MGTVTIICCFIFLFAVPAVLSVDCQTSSCLNQLYNARVVYAYYYIRPLESSRSSSSSSSSSSSGWWSGGRRKRHWNYYRHHTGVVVEIDRPVLTRTRWLIHKGNNYGDRWDTVITDASYMSGRWTLSKQKSVRSCGKTVDDFMRAALISWSYLIFPGPNCQTAANGMWDLIEYC